MYNLITGLKGIFSWPGQVTRFSEVGSMSSLSSQLVKHWIHDKGSHLTLVNVAEELSVLIQDVDTVVVDVCCQDPTLAVCCDTV
uniref:Uncharacterized protein n=1 Tax=Magallana gigas TaxID=29159 RepID=K1R997_MAGGI